MQKYCEITGDSFRLATGAAKGVQILACFASFTSAILKQLSRLDVNKSLEMYLLLQSTAGYLIGFMAIKWLYKCFTCTRMSPAMRDVGELKSQFHWVS